MNTDLRIEAVASVVGIFPPMSCPPESMNADPSASALSVELSVKVVKDCGKFRRFNPNSLWF
jgi:hypothetical protein